jgi:hypothetical protein
VDISSWSGAAWVVHVAPTGNKHLILDWHLASQSLHHRFAHNFKDVEVGRGNGPSDPFWNLSFSLQRIRSRSETHTGAVRHHQNRDTDGHCHNSTRGTGRDREGRSTRKGGCNQIPNREPRPTKFHRSHCKP